MMSLAAILAAVLLVGQGFSAADPAAPQIQPGHWEDLPSELAPIARSEHTAIWTGTAMIVWGGQAGAVPGDPFQPLGDGSAYDAASDEWQALPADGAPSPRFGHTAIWTGAEMIVWGGTTNTDFGASLGNGARYDPIARSWLPLPVAGAPSPRHGHTAIWTGTEMIVWGGDGSRLPPAQDAGARYDPMTDHWAPVAWYASATARNAHTAVWTGERMIIFGGTRGHAVTFPDTPAYDPVADAWSLAAEARAPAARASHTAVWTGTEMIVWAGLAGQFSPGYYLAGDGAVYDPRSDSWGPLPTTAAPAPRRGHTAVWTGTEMLVWGGVGHPADNPQAQIPLRSGGRFRP